MLAAGVVLVSLCAGCVSKQQVVEPMYQEKLDRSSTLAVLPLAVDLLPDIERPPATPLNRRGYDLYYRLFGLLFKDLSNVRVWETGPEFQQEGVSFAMQALALSEDDSIQVPVPSGTVQVEGRMPNFLLLVDDLAFFYGSQESREALGMLSTSRAVITVTCEYVLWDNQDQRLVGYGRIKQEAPTEGGPNVQAPISLLFKRMAASIIQKSPFRLNGAT